MAVKALAQEQKLGVGPSNPPPPRPSATHMLVIYLPAQGDTRTTRELFRTQLDNNPIRVRIPGDDHDLTLTWSALACSRTFLIFTARTQWDAMYVQQMTQLRMQTLRSATGPVRYVVTRVLGSFIDLS